MNYTTALRCELTAGLYDSDLISGGVENQTADNQLFCLGYQSPVRFNNWICGAQLLFTLCGGAPIIFPSEPGNFLIVSVSPGLHNPLTLCDNTRSSVKDAVRSHLDGMQHRAVSAVWRPLLEHLYPTTRSHWYH